MKNKTALIVISVVTALLIIAGVCSGVYYLRQTRYVLKVNGEPLYSAEFKQKLSEDAAVVFSYFNKTYGTEDSKEFWSGSYGGEVPNDVARRRAMDDLVRIKVQQMLARENGIVKDISYSSFLKELKKENERRKKAINGNEVVYGQQSLNEKEYFDYVFGNMVINLKRKLALKLEASDKDVEEYYESNRESKFKLPDAVKIQRICIPFADEKGETSAASKNEAEAEIRNTLDMLDKGVDFEELMKKCNKDGQVLEQTFDQKSLKGDLTNAADLYNEAYKLNPGQISGIVEGSVEYDIIKCTGREPQGYIALEEAQSSIRQELSDQNYTKMVDDLVKSAKIEVNKSVYDKMVVR